jgi:hypothetical protein
MKCSKIKFFHNSLKQNDIHHNGIKQNGVIHHDIYQQNTQQNGIFMTAFFLMACSRMNFIKMTAKKGTAE